MSVLQAKRQEEAGIVVTEGTAVTARLNKIDSSLDYGADAEGDHRVHCPFFSTRRLYVRRCLTKGEEREKAVQQVRDVSRVSVINSTLRRAREEESARERILSMWEIVDIIKISEEEISFLTKGEDPYDDTAVYKPVSPT